MARKRMRDGQRAGLRLSHAEQIALLERVPSLPRGVREAIFATPPSKSVMLTLDDLHDLAGHVAAGASRAGDQKVKKALDRISTKIEKLLDRYAQEAGTETGRTSDLLDFPPEQSADRAATTLPMPARSKGGDERYPVPLTDKQREALIAATRLRRGLKNRVEQAGQGTQAIQFTPKELDELADEVDTSLAFAPSPYKRRLEGVLDKIDDLLDSLEGGEPRGKDREPAEPTDRIYQLRITLRDIQPPIWRRVQVPDCTLSDLHEVIQVAMGWDDGHLHQFIVRGTYYGETVDDDFGLGSDMDVEDEGDVLLSQIIKGGRKMKFRYEYDFGDGWRHDIEVERVIGREPNVNYPRCIEGERACPPEDVGGPWGYVEFVAAITDPKHEAHREMKEWVGGRFDPEKFSAEAVNRQLRRL
jgi:Plasmid pRiA4b ORF-3-like protein